MASGTRSSVGSSSQAAPAVALPADNAGHLASRAQPSRLKPEFVAMSATELVAHLKRNHRRMSDFDAAALVFAERERRLADAEENVRALQAEVQALQQPPRAADARARALQLPRAADDAQGRARRGSGTSGRGRAQQDGRARDVVPKKRPYKANRMHAESPQSSSDESEDTTSDEGMVSDDRVPKHQSLRMNPSSSGYGVR